jgi:hypothetical protein
MASTLSLLKLPILPTIKTRQSSTLKHVPLPSISAKLDILPSPQKQQLLSLDHHQNINLLKHTSLSLTAITLPFLLDTKVSKASTLIFYNHILSCIAQSSLLVDENVNGSGCTCCWWRVWDI